MHGKREKVTIGPYPAIPIADQQVAVTQDPTHELLGSAWVGEGHFELTPSKENLAYFPNEKDPTVRIR